MVLVEINQKNYLNLWSSSPDRLKWLGYDLSNTEDVKIYF